MKEITMREGLRARLNATKIPYKIYADVVDDNTAEQFANCLEAPGVVQAALMPDCHGGYVAPIGSVVKTKDLIYCSMIGYDIGCGMSEALLNLKASDVSVEQLEQIKEEILKIVPIGFSRHNKKQPISRQLQDMPMTDFAKQVLQEQGGTQIGTLGGGNHFLEVGTNNDDYLSIVIHSGSRGVGHKIATYHMKQAAIVNIDKQRYKTEFDTKHKEWYKSFINNKLTHDKQLKKYNEAKEEFVYRRVRARVDNIEDAYPLDVNSKEGQDYINDMNMALQFALDNRRMMIDNTIKAIKSVLSIPVEITRFINRNHNHAELIDSHWIHRKGATQAHKGMYGVIPGNMVDGSFIVIGKGNPDSMSSSSHGAGRVLSRRQAKEQLDLSEFQECTKHLIANHSESNLDEAPKAYKSIFEVMDNQSELVKVVDRIIPILNIKG